MQSHIMPFMKPALICFSAAMAICAAADIEPASNVAESTAAPQFDGIAVSDPAGNLLGDAKRTWIDLVSARVSLSSGIATLDVEVTSPFPSSAQMPGLCADLVLHLLAGADQDPLDPSMKQQSLRFRYSKDGWNPVAILEHDPHTLSAFPIRLTHHLNRLTVEFPSALLSGYSHWAVSTSTDCAPKWRPVTQNPPTATAVLPAPAPIGDGASE